jgi:hypothetical protein
MTAEDMVRDALADLAPRVPAGDEALGGVRRAITRRRRRRTAVRAGVAAVLLVAVAAAGAVALSGGDSEQPSDMIDQPTTTPTSPGGPMPFGPITLTLPEGWVVYDRGPIGTEDVQGEAMCIEPADRPEPRFEDCAGLVMYHGYLPGNENATYEEGLDWAWRRGTDTAACPVGDVVDDQVVPGPSGTDPVQNELRRVGDRDANFARWEAVCEISGYSFDPEAWHLPLTRVLIIEVLEVDETDEILASIEFDGDAPA